MYMQIASSHAHQHQFSPDLSQKRALRTHATLRCLASNVTPDQKTSTRIWLARLLFTVRTGTVEATRTRSLSIPDTRTLKLLLHTQRSSRLKNCRIGSLINIPEIQPQTVFYGNITPVQAPILGKKILLADKSDNHVLYRRQPNFVTAAACIMKTKR